ncbi:unnamed protein product [Haemonchus placei]|uniref:Transcriptional regulator n=1 Tax=Haemonchus placei TaxID=6290 RepID=A0A0N4VZQ6_HAEPC|nr:unnamed protein product [Haemonchus placei]
MIDHIHSVTRAIEASQEYRLLLRLTSIDLEKTIDFIEAETVNEGLSNGCRYFAPKSRRVHCTRSRSMKGKT